ncbi:hypothetical protein NZD89_28950 (plasmid) [Alicyclobacillus fastidiosus]|uniref:GDT1 family protein n=1 Tax=Alicyclobacillus fastidiosus TaxID=392011 RepID=A0ABY6ZPW2_9BACL|nr:hypothetical protein [Alicyclobacillus fastidiosus]WAH45013.1 hypothetical protein NZD89_28950 [Alicyclobacillus fastidiosus]GMA66289.1 hypothetical protein GCM10025859_67310 [Alicyclobacillus fastidiosus]GMA66338.1 hypothetical protein GCM10025859_67800 [Alicyclobacillus fastidiosus]
MDIYAIGASFIGTFVEFVEALTIILAAGAIRGFKSSLLGAFSAAVILGALIAIIGTPLVHVIQLFWVQLFVGLFMLLFGIRWLRKAILRYSGMKALHNEAESYEKELKRQQATQKDANSTIDRFAFGTAFTGTFLEGLEAIFIVITFGLSAKAMSSAIVGAFAAMIVVVILGVTLRTPLTKVPENTLKFIVGVMLTSFGAFWLGESFGVAWPQKDLSILYMVVTLLVISFILVQRCKRALVQSKHLPQSGGIGSGSK